jgi:ABC-type nitrate/sulfonate/bicarbonate transport system ATPase subunit
MIAQVSPLRPAPPPTPELVGGGALTLCRVSKTYEVNRRPVPVLADLDLQVAPGEFVSLVGASGCGKSTILRLVVGLDREHGGSIQLDGRPITGPGLERSIVFQEHRLLPWLTVADNVALGLTDRAPAAPPRLEGAHLSRAPERG